MAIFDLSVYACVQPRRAVLADPVSTSFFVVGIWHGSHVPRVCQPASGSSSQARVPRCLYLLLPMSQQLPDL